MMQTKQLSKTKVTVTTTSPGDLFAFQTWVHVDGYEVTPMREDDAAEYRSTSEILLGKEGASGYGLIPGEITPKGFRAEMRRPFELSGDLAREFAAVGRTPAAVLAFTDRFGLLHPTNINTLEGFYRLNGAVRALLGEIDGVTRNGLFAPHERRAKLDVLSKRFNRDISDTFKFKLSIPSAADGDRAMRLVPDSLLSAIGLMIAYELSGALDWRQCAHCGKWFAAGAPAERVRGPKAETCSDACSTALNEARKTERRRAAAPVFAPRVCFHCNETFQPKRADTPHCGKPACKTAFSRLKASQERGTS